MLYVRYMLFSLYLIALVLLVLSADHFVYILNWSYGIIP